jgi:hypothetical protein
VKSVSRVAKSGDGEAERCEHTSGICVTTSIVLFTVAEVDIPNKPNPNAFEFVIAGPALRTYM